MLADFGCLTDASAEALALHRLVFQHRLRGSAEGIDWSMLGPNTRLELLSKTPCWRILGDSRTPPPTFSHYIGWYFSTAYEAAREVLTGTWLAQIRFDFQVKRHVGGSWVSHERLRRRSRITLAGTSAPPIRQRGRY